MLWKLLVEYLRPHRQLLAAVVMPLLDTRLRQALKRSTAGATLVIIAQRTSSILDADQILVPDGGRTVRR